MCVCVCVCVCICVCMCVYVYVCVCVLRKFNTDKAIVTWIDNWRIILPTLVNASALLYPYKLISCFSVNLNENKGRGYFSPISSPDGGLNPVSSYSIPLS